jgi:hypothetical protein
VRCPGIQIWRRLRGTLHKHRNPDVQGPGHLYGVHQLRPLRPEVSFEIAFSRDSRPKLLFSSASKAEARLHDLFRTFEKPARNLRLFRVVKISLIEA